MRAFVLGVALSLSLCACSYETPGSCARDGDCSVGTLCQSQVCVSCPSGLCPASATVGAAGDKVTVLLTPWSFATNVATTFNPGVLPDGTLVGLRALLQRDLPSPIGDNIFLGAFELTTAGVTSFNGPVRITADNVSTLKAGNVVSIAKLSGGAWIEVARAVTGLGGALRTLHVSATLPGVTTPGTYVIYRPPPGFDYGVTDFGVCLIPNDGVGKIQGLQVVSLYDDAGKPLAHPTATVMTDPGAADLDGAALTPDGSQGAMVDGSNYVVFFSNALIGAPTISAAKVDITNYGGDGDAIAIFPDGDQVLVAGDNNELVVITGVASGSPQLAMTVALPGDRDGMVISNDGKVLIARGTGSGGPGMTVLRIDPVTPVAGPLGGMVSHSFIQTANFIGATVPSGEDGRDGMAFSPTDSTSAVVIGAATGQRSGTSVIQLFTGLPGTPDSPPAFPAEVPISGIGPAMSVVITPDGKRAIVGGVGGLVMFAGVDSGNLFQVGPPFNPPGPG